MNSLSASWNGCPVMLWRLISVLIVSGLAGLTTSQSTTPANKQGCIVPGLCINTVGLLDNLIKDNQNMKTQTSRFQVQLEDQAQQMRNFRATLNSALWSLPKSQFLTTATTSYVQYYNYVMYGGKIYSVSGSSTAVTGLRVHNAYTGSVVEVLNTPAGGVNNHIQLAVCRYDGILFMTGSEKIWYADISQRVINSKINWQTWFPAKLAQEKRSINYFGITNDCQEVYLKYSSEVQIRRYSDGELLVARILRERAHVIVGGNQRYYVSHSDPTNGNSYVVGYDQQLREKNRYTALRGTGNGGSFYTNYLALFEDGSIFIANHNITFFKPDFEAFLEFMPQSVRAQEMYYDPDSKLLGVSVYGTSTINIYRLTRDFKGCN